MPGATPVKRKSTVAMVVEVRSKEGMKVDEGEHRRTGNRNLFINGNFCPKAPAQYIVSTSLTLSYLGLGLFGHLAYPETK